MDIQSLKFYHYYTRMYEEAIGIHWLSHTWHYSHNLRTASLPMSIMVATLEVQHDNSFQSTSIYINSCYVCMYTCRDNNVVHNSPLANQVSVPMSFWHLPELQHIYPIGCKLLTCCYRECSCYGSVLWLQWTDQWPVWTQYHHQL